MDGFVALVGAGPGDAELLTVKALRRLQQAEVVVFDRLVGEEILALIPASAEQFDVGKRCGAPSLSQGAINRLLVQQALRGKRVVRLKGGDPFVFGRGGEEALSLAEAGIPYEVVPGITAALGCGAATQIPLTHRGLARSVTLVTGHLQDGSCFAPWQALVKGGGTLVFYMGLEQAARIEQGLLAAGAAPDLPVALVVAGTSARQQVITSCLSALSQQALALKGQSPVLMILGEVVMLREQLQRLAVQSWRRVA
ncbi:uroporphyrinogen-III C-methyltransferase [Pseudaeromonas sp. ZJS20]|uniref:uroporphyrinogen-III C-methyltransferase n=1 Tax=Pseudaeromonas aegiceratis TaxID=3153928 RepID=UPI00390C42E1